MEETIWMVFGVLGLLLALGIIGPLLVNYNSSLDEEKMKQQLKEFQNQASFLCTTEIGNALKNEIILFYNSTLYTNGDKVCIQKEDELICERISCRYRDYSFTLDSEFAKEFSKLTYQCDSEVVGRGLLSINCGN